jgi:hypothetical protein
MITREESEKLYLYCLEELRLIIEHPYENDALEERLTTIRNKLEILYRQKLLKQRC